MSLISFTPFYNGNDVRNSTMAVEPGRTHQYVLLISIMAGACSFLTIIGNVVVIASFLINKSLRNFSNYLILSLAVSDLTIGAFSMNVFTSYNVHKAWILGEVMCKAWLTVDYTASNASVMNLLVICVDRYVAITKPVKYRKWCSPKRAAIAITAVWTLSFLMWGPAIILWDILSSNAKMPPNDCYIPFMKNNAAVTVATIVGAFYFPATVMCALYYKVISKLRRRRKGLKSIAVKGSLAMAASLRFPDYSSAMSEKRKSTESGTKSLVVAVEHRGAESSFIPTTEGPSNCDKEIIADHNESPADTTYSLLNKTAEGLKQEPLMNVPNGSSLSPQGVIPLRTTRRSGSFTQKHNSYLKITRRFSAGTKGSFREPPRVVRERRVAVLLKFILMCFIILWLPYSLIMVITSFWPSIHVPDYIWNLSYWLCYLNSTVNPFCYGFCNENFRQTFIVIITSKWWKKEVRKSLRLSRRTNTTHLRHTSMYVKKQYPMHAKVRKRFSST